MCVQFEKRGATFVLSPLRMKHFVWICLDVFADRFLKYPEMPGESGCFGFSAYKVLPSCFLVDALSCDLSPCEPH